MSEKDMAEKSAAKKAAKKAPAKKAVARKSVKKTAEKPKKAAKVTSEKPAKKTAKKVSVAEAAFVAPLFQAPDPTVAPKKTAKAATKSADTKPADTKPAKSAKTAPAVSVADAQDSDSNERSGDPRRRRRRRGGRGRRRGTDGGASVDIEETTDDTQDSGEQDESDESDSAGGTRRRRRRRRRGSGDGDDADVSSDDPPNTVVRVRKPREARDDISGIKGSTRLEAKKQRRREGREAGRRRSVLTESEFLARREAVDRVMVVRERGDRTQIAVIEDNILVEHYVTRAGSHSLIGNVYLGKVQNVLPSMEAAFVDIGRGRNAVLYAGEVNWENYGVGPNDPKRVENIFKTGDSVVVQVTKDPIGHKGARLTNQISLPGRFLVYVPGGTLTGISRKLPENERNRLKNVLRAVLPEDAGVIVRTAAEGASEEELSRDVSRLKAQWENIKEKSTTANAPSLLYAEPDLAIKVVRDIFNEDFNKLLVQGTTVWETLEQYISYVAPDLMERVSKWVEPTDIFTSFRVDEQITKALDRKVWLPSGGSLVIDRTEAMTVVDVNTGKFTGAGSGNLEETVTKNNIEAAEEIVRQLRLRDIGGIIVIDFIDMVLESNRDLVLRRLLECLGRDRTKHQVAEVTSLGLVQMTRKRIGQGLLEVFSENCEHCNGRGVRITSEPVAREPKGEHTHDDHDEPRAERESGRQESGRRERHRQRDRHREDHRGSESKATEQRDPEIVEPLEVEPVAVAPVVGASGKPRRRASRPAGAPVLTTPPQAP